MSNFKEITPEEYKGNVFNDIGKKWMLITAAKDGKVNTMTASWGNMGVMWGKDIVSVFIRQTRFTKEFELIMQTAFQFHSLTMKSMQRNLVI